jgi:peptidoglycan/LPS O-acetylase OafA/YrhL
MNQIFNSYIKSSFTYLSKDRFEEEARKFGKQLSTQFVFNGYISVSNFFFLSGLVVTYVSLPLMTKKRGPTFIKYVSIRWLRFIPPLIGAICFHILWPLLGSGPVFKQISTELTKPCVKNWWTNVLLINNWLLLPEMVSL